MTLVAVYGSLRRGMGNHRLIEKYPLICTTCTEGLFRMHDVANGAFPAIVPDERAGDHIKVEVYEVDDAGLASIDALEGHPVFYTRQQEDMLQPFEEHVWLYVQRPEQVKGTPVVPGGDWVHYKENL